MNAHSPSPERVPTPPTPRQAEILDRAAELVAEAGLANLTMKRVAERVGFTEPAIYRHYPGKSALLVAMIEPLGGRLIVTMEGIAGDRRLAPQERLLAMVRHHVALLRRREGCSCRRFLGFGLTGALGGIQLRHEPRHFLTHDVRDHLEAP